MEVYWLQIFLLNGLTNFDVLAKSTKKQKQKIWENHSIGMVDCCCDKEGFLAYLQATDSQPYHELIPLLFTLSDKTGSESNQYHTQIDQSCIDYDQLQATRKIYLKQTYQMISTSNSEYIV